jgi:hypothetical protein
MIGLAMIGCVGGGVKVGVGVSKGMAVHAEKRREKVKRSRHEKEDRRRR